jgi:hypothetical protein
MSFPYTPNPMNAIGATFMSTRLNETVTQYQIDQLRKELEEERTERKKLHVAFKEFEQHLYTRMFLNSQPDIFSIRGSKQVNTFIAFLRKTYMNEDDLEQMLMVNTQQDLHHFVINHPLYLQHELDKYTEFNLP